MAPEGEPISSQAPTGGPVPPADHFQTNWMSWLMAQRSSDEPMGTPSFAIRLDYFQRILPLGQLTRGHTISYGWSTGCFIT